MIFIRHLYDIFCNIVKQATRLGCLLFGFVLFKCSIFRNKAANGLQQYQNGAALAVPHLLYHKIPKKPNKYRKYYKTFPYLGVGYTLKNTQTIMKIFAYGSNMNIERLRERVPSATKLTNAVINNYFFTCNKISVDGSSKANIVHTDNSDDLVWGIIFKIDDNEKNNLDRAEGLGKGYNEATLNFTDPNGEIHQAQVYIADNNSINDELLPYDWYKNFIITGAQQNQLPDDYIDKIASIQSTVDKNEKRRQTNLAISNRQT